MRPTRHATTTPWLSILLLTLGTLNAISALGQPAYPVKNIRVIVPSPTGGPSDIVARLIGDKMAQAFGKQVVIDNRTGASQIIGTVIVAKAEPDGYTLLQAAANMAINAVNVPDLPYEGLGGMTVTRLGKRHKAEPVIKSATPRGDTVYWVGAAGGAQDAGEGTDFYATTNGLVSITPLQIDLTRYPQLQAVRDWMNIQA
jgi:hypothetical protein